MSLKIIDPCPNCGAQLEFDEVDIGVGVQRGNPHCDECYWHPDAIKVTCECGCGRTGYTTMMEYHHPEDYKHDESA